MDQDPLPVIGEGVPLTDHRPLCHVFPPIRNCNVYGIDMPTRSELVAYNRSPAEIARTIGADRVIYLSLKDLVDSVLSCAGPECTVTRFDTSVFDGMRGRWAISNFGSSIVGECVYGSGRAPPMYSICNHQHKTKS